MSSIALPAESGATTRALELATLLALGAIASVATVGLLVHSPVLVSPTWTAIVRALYVAAYVAAGAYTWWRRPTSLAGPLIAGAGLLFALTAPNGSGDPAAHTVGMTIWTGCVVYLTYLYLAFPRSRLAAPIERALVVWYAVYVAATWTAILVFSNKLPTTGVFTDCGEHCPHNSFQIFDAGEPVAAAFRGFYTIGTITATLGVAALILRKIRSPNRLRRRAMEPLGVAYIGTIAVFVLFMLIAPAYPDAKPTLRAFAAVSQLAIPFAMVLGQIRGRTFAATNVARLVASMGGRPITPEVVEELIRNMLGDPTLALVFPTHDEDLILDVRGVAVRPQQDSKRLFTPVVLQGRTVAALVHDAGLDTDPSVIEGVAASALMLLENARLVEELRASRMRLVTVADQERQRLERNLHDGAQQRLMALQIKLALAKDRAVTDEVLTEQLSNIEFDAAEAVEELRELAHGIYPAVLRDRGLVDALRTVAVTAPIRIEVHDEGTGRTTPTVEAAIYFCALEAIQNAIKHAGPNPRVEVALTRRHNTIEFAITDDGVGMPLDTPEDGFGLSSMRDRIGAVGGKLDVLSSGPGAGTRVSGVVPDPGSEPL